jgi:hypothetical protein
MTHLHHPSLSLSGKKKGKKKFRNAEEARKSRELDESWKAMQQKWGTTSTKKSRKSSSELLQYKLSTPAGRETQKISSLDTGHTGAVRTKDIPQYTGTKIKGIGTMHKSNAVPIFSDEEAVDISKMRR